MKVLITGGSGFLGARIVRFYEKRWECAAPAHKELDIRESGSCKAFLKAFGPDVVIHTAAISDMGECDREPKRSRDINVMGMEHLARACAMQGARLIFMSSDQVYNGNHTDAPNREEDPLCPENEYARQKLEAEQRALLALPDAVGLRLTWMYDLPTEHLDTKANFLTTILDSIRNGSRLTFSDQEYRGVTYVREVVENIEKLLTVPGGIYNFGSPAAGSTYELAKRVFQMLGGSMESGLLHPREDVMKRSLNMNQERIRRHGISFSENEAGIRRCLKDFRIPVTMENRKGTAI